MTKYERKCSAILAAIMILLGASIVVCANVMQNKVNKSIALDSARATERCERVCENHGGMDTWIWQRLTLSASERRCFCNDNSWVVIP